jgi:hypothetical protein
MVKNKFQQEQEDIQSNECLWKLLDLKDGLSRILSATGKILDDKIDKYRDKTIRKRMEEKELVIRKVFDFSKFNQITCYKYFKTFISELAQDIAHEEKMFCKINKCYIVCSVKTTEIDNNVVIIKESVNIIRK